MREKRFKKVREWGYSIFGKESINDGEALLVSLCLIVPIVGQILFFYMLKDSIRSRKVYWAEDKNFLKGGKDE